ncbi:MAG: RNA polymerase sigma factor [Saprospiraceae bacterium]|nr:RNA polymerase sigma factor [Saprospiraceae bacterium]
MDDALLVSKCLDGNQQACKVLFDTYSPGMMAVCMRYFSSRTEAEDALQDGFIKIFQNLHQWNSTGPLPAWIRRVVVNTCLTAIRKKFPAQDFDLSDHHQNLAVNPEIHSQMDYKSILNHLNQMPVGYRTVFNLFVVEGYQYDEIAEMLQIKETTCRSQLFRAKHFLANRLSKEYPELKLSL